MPRRQAPGRYEVIFRNSRPLEGAWARRRLWSKRAAAILFQDRFLTIGAITPYSCPFLDRILLMAEPGNQSGDNPPSSDTGITPEQLSKKLSDLIPPSRSTIKTP